MKKYIILQKLILINIYCTITLFIGFIIANQCPILRVFYDCIFKIAKHNHFLNIFDIHTHSIILGIGAGLCFFGLISIPFSCFILSAILLKYEVFLCVSRPCR